VTGVKTNERPGTKAVHRYCGMSASKARQVLDLIRGYDAERAQEILKFCERDAAITVGKLLASAVANAEQSNINWGKAGRMRWKGKRPTVRGVVMNPVDHPHGGGEGKTSGGRHPVSPWGKPEGRTRKAHKPSDKLIVRRRRTGKKHHR